MVHKIDYLFSTLTLLNVASLSASRVGPHAGARVLVEVQSSGALDFDGLSLDAVEEHVADGRVRVGEETVAARTLGCGLGGFCWACKSWG